MIEFSHSLKASGRLVPWFIQRPLDVEAMARDLESEGCEFHMERMASGLMSLSVLRPPQDVPLAVLVCEGGMSLAGGVDALMRMAQRQL